MLVDHFTHFAFIFTSKTQKARDFITLLNKILSKGIKHGTLLTGQYSSINSNEFKLFLKQHNVNLIFIAVDRAFSNGLNERLNQTLVNQIRCRINEDSLNPNVLKNIIILFIHLLKLAPTIYCII